MVPRTRQEVVAVARWTPDPSFYPSPLQAAQAPPETHAYVATLNTGTHGDRAPDALTVLDLEQGSPTYGQLVGRLDMPGLDDELHHFGWNACSALGDPGGDGPGGIFLLDHDDFSVKGAWEDDRGTQELAYDFWWHLGFDTVVTSEWGTPNMVEGGLIGARRDVGARERAGDRAARRGDDRGDGRRRRRGLRARGRGGCCGRRG
jgi:hypothetical protein